MTECEIYDEKTCAHCGASGIVRKLKLIFKYNKSARCCFYCIEQLGGIENTKIWLEKHVNFNSKAQYWFE